MKKLLSALLALAVVIFGFGSPALAGDIANGAKIFSGNCAACHLGGGNVVMATKTLKAKALEDNKMNSEAAIIKQVTGGKGAMPSFKGKLSETEIADVAAYVLDKADKGW